MGTGMRSSILTERCWPTSTSQQFKHSIVLTYANSLKRFIDVVISVVVLVISLPLTLVVAVALAFNNNGRIFFIQPRPGYRERIFLLFKFKTMNDRKDAAGH